MRSQLTRNAYRRLLAGHGWLWPCLTPSGRSHYSQCRPRPPAQALLRHPPRRSFLGLFQPPPREPKQPVVEPGYDVLLKFRAMETEDARPPDRKQLIAGLARFFRGKYKSRLPITETQAFLAHRVLRYLVDNPPDGEGAVDDIEPQVLKTGLMVIQSLDKSIKSRDFVELAKLLYAELEWRRKAQAGEELKRSEEAYYVNFEAYLACLTRFGASLEALELLNEYRATLSVQEQAHGNFGKLWSHVLQGLVHEGREKELLAECQRAMDLGIGYSQTLHYAMTSFYINQDDVEEVKRWFERPIKGGGAVSRSLLLAVFSFAARNGLQQWGQSVIEKLALTKPKRYLWDLSYRWSVLAMDTGVEGIKQMIAKVKEETGLEPDGTTINHLLEAAIEKKNPFLAERFVSLGAELGIEPTPSTYLLQMDYRLDAKDLSGVEHIYQKIINRELEFPDKRAREVLSKYLSVLCRAEKPDIQRILDVTGQMEMYHPACLLPDTIVDLCMVLLHNDQQFDVIDTLSLHTVMLGLQDRAKIWKALVDYCLDTKVSTARVWDAYSLLRQFFPETEPADRVRLMEAFFARRRPDMACNIFGHMRGHANPVQRPTADIYVRCLEGLGRWPHHESLKLIHNMLKMDTTVNVDTRIRNGLMIAYTAVGDPSTALEFWEQISASSEGPTNNSLAAVFWACERLEFRSEMAKKLWKRIQRLDLEVPPSVLNAYCGALAGQGQLNEVKEAIGSMEATQGYSPSPMTLGVTFNALPPPAKEPFEVWAKEEYPKIWARLKSKGRKTTMEGDMFNIERTFEA
ncbi:complex I intermediate-associated protein 84, mitochondrial [Podospora aff. communis PSN243]|uniref:Complex I intermediate-associated protein 84, mitochondrial n=1 Tax=Podospora aff. communis PSN243 TaxID=3040156 RepID=A0AAV9GVF4_9PEZI|nr:complex I intermediate-associated protein 84, mitochondrial [Podospora aff. communis PSN243]